MAEDRDAAIERLFARDDLPLPERFRPDVKRLVDGPPVQGRIGRYSLRGELARGGFGAVYQAHDPELVREVAIKLLHAPPDAGRRARFARESEALARLNHPNVVRVFEVGEEQGRPYLVMELVLGPTLLDRLLQGPLPIPEAVRIARGLSEALAHAHNLGVVHRDVKPGNVILQGGQPRLTDFGLARFTAPAEGHTQLSMTGDMLGTPGYWSPEQAHGRRDQISGASDVYGLGATLYASLTGRPPYDGSTLIEVVSAMDSPPEPPRRLRAEIPAALERIVLRCLERDPSARYSAAELADLLADRFDPGRAGQGSRLRGIAMLTTSLAAGVGIALALTSSPRDTSPRGLSADSSSPARPSPLSSSSEQAQPSAKAQREEAEQEILRSFLSGDREATVALAEELRVTDPSSTLAWYVCAISNHQVGRFQEARAQFDRVLELDPSHEAAWKARGDLRLELGDEAGARADYAQSLELPPVEWPGVEPLRRGTLLYRMGRFEEALGELTEVLRREPAHAGALILRGTVLAELREFESAWRDLDAALATRPNSAELHGVRGRLRIMNGEWIAAREELNKAIRKDPNRPESYVNRAQVHMELNDPEAALVDLLQARQLNPRSPRTYVLLADLHRKLGQTSEQLASLESLVLELGVESPEVWEKIASLRAETLDYPGVVEATERALRIGSTNPTGLLRLRVFADLAQGHVSAAHRDMDRLEQLLGDRMASARLELEQAMTVAMAGRWGHAQMILRQAPDPSGVVYQWRAAFGDPDPALSTLAREQGGSGWVVEIHQSRGGGRVRFPPMEEPRRTQMLSHALVHRGIRADRIGQLENARERYREALDLYVGLDWSSCFAAGRLAVLGE